MHIIAQLSIHLRKPIIKLVHKPTPVTVIGRGKAKKVGALLAMMSVKKAFVITGPVVRQMGMLDGVLKGMASAGVEAIVFDDVQSDPTFDGVEKAVKNYADCDALVAVGGGSVLDTAKAVGAAVASNEPAVRLAGMLKVKHRLPSFIAVPTTAGTGSETTVAAVISDSETHEKKQMLDPKLVPAIAVLDPEMTVGLPLHTTAHTGIDALTHALEAYVSGYADEETDRDACIAIKLIYENLPNVRKRSDDLAAREALLTASFFAGKAFTRTYVGYVHAFAHTIGGRFHIPHGLANAVLLPHVMEYYLPVCTARFARLAELTGICPAQDSREQKAKKFVRSLFDLNRQFDIPDRFENIPADAVDDIITAAFRECHGTYPVPRYYNRGTARQLMRKVCGV